MISIPHIYVDRRKLIFVIIEQYYDNKGVNILDMLSY